MLRVFERLGSIQFDPLSIAGRNHDLVLQARIEGYQPAWTEALLYGQRALFEAYNKGLSILPTHELPWYRLTWDRSLEHHEAGAFRDHPEVISRILERIEREGPLSSLDFERDVEIDWYWRPTNRIRALLEALAQSGRLGLARRVSNRRYYDLAERLFSAELLARREPRHEQFRHKLLSRYRAHGLLGSSGSAELWIGTGTAVASDDGRLPGRRVLQAELVESGALVPVEVEGVRGLRLVVREELPLLEQALYELDAGVGPGGSDPGVSFLAPLDPFVWDRPFLRALYDFDYVWEVYVPEQKRRWGYYVLPVLFGDRLVGRIEPRIERSTGTVRIVGLWWEPEFRPLQEPGFVPAMRAALAAYRAFGAAESISWTEALRSAARNFTPRRTRRQSAAAPRSALPASSGERE